MDVDLFTDEWLILVFGVILLCEVSVTDYGLEFWFMDLNDE